MSTTTRRIVVPEGSRLTEEDYRTFLRQAYEVMRRHEQYFAPGEDIGVLELAHLIPAVPETLIAIYLGINDAACNKGLVAWFLVNHAHNNVFAFDPDLYPGGRDVPSGSVDVREILSGFEPPNATWNPDWTYVVIRDPARSVDSLWKEKGYIDMIPAKFEDFTMLSDPERSKVCFFINPRAFDHPVNAGRAYLREARTRGEKTAAEFAVPSPLAGETDGLVPAVLHRGEKLYVATPDFSPCDHAWSNLHADNTEPAVVNENSAVPLDLVVRKPPVDPRYAGNLKPPLGSADMTTDCFKRGKHVYRKPLLAGAVKG